MISVVELKDLHWDYHDSGKPTLRTIPQIEHNWGRVEKCDPFPCYTHDADLVQRVAQECWEEAPLGVPCAVNIAHYESLARTNGWATWDDVWKSKLEEGDPEWEGIIFLSGRRVEIHPAVTRYVVPHEYGHLVQRRLEQILFPDLWREGDQAERALKDAYCKLREIDQKISYGGGSHHLHWQEFFANDFRTYVMRSEVEFWPHPLPRLTEDDPVAEWWNVAIEELRKHDGRE